MSISLLHRSTFTAVKEQQNCSALQPTLQPVTLAPELVNLLRKNIRFLLESSHPNVTLLAEFAGMSLRSFQRLLKKNHLSYTVLVDQVRYEMAVHLLQDPSPKVIEIAMELGYNEPASFCRAFKRWSGLSPCQFRQRCAKSSVNF